MFKKVKVHERVSMKRCPRLVAGCSPLYVMKLKGSLLISNIGSSQIRSGISLRLKMLFAFHLAVTAAFTVLNFEAAQVLTYLSINSTRWKGTSLQRVRVNKKLGRIGVVCYMSGDLKTWKKVVASS